MEKSIKLHIDINGNQVDFPIGKEQIEISAFTADYKRMGNAPTITCTVKYPTCLDNEWTYGVYTMFNDERFYFDEAGYLTPDGIEIEKGTVVTDSVTSDQLQDFLENKLGLVHHRFKRGYKNVINEAVRLNKEG